MQDINHRHELEQASDSDLQKLFVVAHASIQGQRGVARAYLRARRDMAKQILKERADKRMYLACIEQ